MVQLLLGNVRCAWKHLDAALAGILGVDGVGLVSCEAVRLVERRLPAEEVMRPPPHRCRGLAGSPPPMLLATGTRSRTA